jgi:hypothetical protein
MIRAWKHILESVDANMKVKTIKTIKNDAATKPSASHNLLSLFSVCFLPIFFCAFSFSDASCLLDTLSNTIDISFSIDTSFNTIRSFLRNPIRKNRPFTMYTNINMILTARATVAKEKLGMGEKHAVSVLLPAEGVVRPAEHEVH